jgi:uncharacterized pyridoxamine 5'-phosphate oxidase family protein
MEKIINEYLDKPLEVCTVLKEICNGATYFYLVGPYFVYTNDYNFPQIRPHKFIFDDHISIASEDEKKLFIEMLKKNHLIVNENYEVKREFEIYNLTAKVKVKSNISKEELINKLNEICSSISEFDVKFIDF